METTLYNQQGTSAGKLTLPENLFGLRWNADLVHQVVTGMMSNARAGTADTKGRGEVRGGGKKPWKQKGTGRARHGSIRSPLWKGGGTTHGPLAEKNYKKKINKKMKVKALLTVLSEKNRRGEILFVESLSFPTIKTKSAADMMTVLAKIDGFKKLGYKRKNVAILALPGRDANTEKSFGNIAQIETLLAKDLNPVDLLRATYLVVVSPKDMIETLSAKLA